VHMLAQPEPPVGRAFLPWPVPFKRLRHAGISPCEGSITARECAVPLPSRGASRGATVNALALHFMLTRLPRALASLASLRPAAHVAALALAHAGPAQMASVMSLLYAMGVLFWLLHSDDALMLPGPAVRRPPLFAHPHLLSRGNRGCGPPLPTHPSCSPPRRSCPRTPAGGWLCADARPSIFLAEPDARYASAHALLDLSRLRAHRLPFPFFLPPTPAPSTGCSLLRRFLYRLFPCALQTATSGPVHTWEAEVRREVRELSSAAFFQSVILLASPPSLLSPSYPASQLAAPFLRVEFCDFFVADILISFSRAAHDWVFSLTLFFSGLFVTDVSTSEEAHDGLRRAAIKSPPC